MRLIVGGAFQGKREYVKERFALEDPEIKDGGSAGFEDLFSCRCMYDFQEWIKKGLKENWNLEGIEERLERDNPELILISNELGCGVVPMDPFDRKYRETAGRICSRLAKKSREVIRVVCGIGTVLKHD